MAKQTLPRIIQPPLSDDNEPTTYGRGGPVDVSGTVVAILAGVASTLIAALIIYLVSRANPGRAERLTVRQILRPDDPDVGGFIDLYMRAFPGDEGNAAGDMVRWIGEYQRSRKDRHRTLDDYYYVAKHGNRVVGILNFQYYRVSRYLHIAYLAVSAKKDGLARAKARDVLVGTLIRLLHGELRQCRAALFEIIAPSASVSTRENLKRRARKELFQAAAKRVGLTAYQLGIEFLHPKFRFDDDDHEVPYTLLYIPFDSSPVGNSMPKSQVLELLRFMYEEEFGDMFEDDVQKDRAWREYMMDLLAMYERELEGVVPLMS